MGKSFKKKVKKVVILLILLGLTGFFSYLYSVNNSKYMPKNKLFKCHDYTSKNHSFSNILHFTYQNVFHLHLEIILPNLFSAQSLSTQKMRSFQLQS